MKRAESRLEVLVREMQERKKPHVHEEWTALERHRAEIAKREIAELISANGKAGRSAIESLGERPDDEGYMMYFYGLVAEEMEAMGELVWHCGSETDFYTFGDAKIAPERIPLRDLARKLGISLAAAARLREDVEARRDR